MKLDAALHRLVCSNGASPPGNGGRGLKRGQVREKRRADQGIAPRQRGAWIETVEGWPNSAQPMRIAPRQRGAWIETGVTHD